MKKFLLITLKILLAVSPAYSGSIQLYVPIIKQSEGRLCGPASIEMIYKYWGDKRSDQYDIAKQIANEYSTEKRFLNSSFLIGNNPKDFPGTPAYLMKRFLSSRATTEKYSLKRRNRYGIEES